MRLEATGLTGFAAALAVAAAGCGDPRRADVQVSWTFAGQTCQQAGVAVIQVDVAHEALTPNQFFCHDPKDGSLRTGAILESFLFGTYRVTVSGLDADGAVLYQSSQDFTVQAGQNLVQVDAKSAFATADVAWDALLSSGGFALGALGAMTCSEAQVDKVRIRLDPRPDGTGGTALNDVPCASFDADGKEFAGAQVSPLTAGTHSFAITAIRNTASGPLVVYQTTRPASASFQLGLVTNVDVDADPVGLGRGTVTLVWEFPGNMCPGTVSYTLTDPSGFKQPVQSAACGDPPPPLPSFNLTSGLWQIDATAGALQAHALFGVPNLSSASWTISFTP